MKKYQTAFEYLGKQIGSDEGYKLAVLANMMQTPPRKRVDPKTEKEVNMYDPAILELYFKNLPKTIMAKLDEILSEVRKAQVAVAKKKK